MCIIALVAFAAWAPNVEAWVTFDNDGAAGTSCVTCHGAFSGANYTSSTSQDPVAWGANLHDGHRRSFVPSCTDCHQAIGDNPLIGGPSGGPNVQSCVGCHGRDEDVTPNDGAFGGPGPGRGDGLRAHHAATGTAICAGCHSADTTPVGEDVDPAYYVTLAIDPCSDAQLGVFGLDNDGDNDYDANDPDCGPPPVEICDNGIDDTGNGLIDCEDPACDGFVGAPTECGVGACAAAGNLVCQTPDQVDTCTPLTPQAEGPFGDPTCADGVDNDCDGLTDAADPDCEAPPEICDNGIDDNGNGLVDCADPQCEDFVGAPTTCGIGACEATGNLVCQGGAEVDTCVPGAPGTEGPAGDPTCADGVDNDCNGLTDAADPACEAVVEEICDNGIDDNGNGLIDCADPQCEGFVDGPCDTGQPGICAAGTFVCQGGAQVCVQDQQAGQEGPFGDPTCEDGLDNDCNGLTDAADPACQAPVEEICDNGIDDNDNGLIDCEDPACDGFVNGACDTGEPGICAAGTFVCQNLQSFCVQDQQPQQEGPAGDPSCQDGLDNDCDGLADAADPGCQAVAVEAEIEVPGAINAANRGLTPIEIEFDDDNGMPVEIAELRCGGDASNAMATPVRINAEDEEENEFTALFNTRDELNGLNLTCEDTAIVCVVTLADGTELTVMDETRVVRAFNGERCRDDNGEDD